MYANKLLDAYKTANNYVQDKQIAHDLSLSRQKISAIRKGQRYLTEKEALFIAESLKISEEEVLVYLAADKAKEFKAQQVWANIAKKYKGLGMTLNSMAYVGVTGLVYSVFEHTSECVLCILC